MECYIDYLDSSNNFMETRKSFKDCKSANKWLMENVEDWNLDMVHFY
jgi:hypothetical protein